MTFNFFRNIPKSVTTPIVNLVTADMETIEYFQSFFSSSMTIYNYFRTLGVLVFLYVNHNKQKKKTLSFLFVTHSNLMLIWGDFDPKDYFLNFAYRTVTHELATNSRFTQVGNEFFCVSSLRIFNPKLRKYIHLYFTLFDLLLNLASHGILKNLLAELNY